MNAKPMADWFTPNRTFYRDFREWLRDGGYGDSALSLYSVAARLALSTLDKPYWEIAETDLDRVHQCIIDRYESEGTRSTYRKGLVKLSEYIHHRRGHKPPPKPVNWDYYTGSLPDWLTDDIRDYIVHCRRAWGPERQYRATLETLSHLTRSLRWMAAQAALDDVTDLTPNLWFDYVDYRLEDGIKPRTLNRELWGLQGFLRFLHDVDRPICERTLRIRTMDIGDPLPRDVPVDQLRALMTKIEAEAAADEPARRRVGLLDRAWFLLMVHCGLRSGEVRRLKQAHLDLEGRKLRVEQSKGLKDRVVPLSHSASTALRAYLEVRGPAPTDHIFIYRHRALGTTYCNHRLHTYGQRCGVTVSCHPLRHSAATMLLNAGAPLVAVQTILGHRFIETTLRYARLYDGTLAADYYRAVGLVESRMQLVDGEPQAAPNAGQMLALVDSLFSGTLNDDQREVAHALRTGILAWVQREP